VAIAAILYANGETAARGAERFARRLAGPEGQKAMRLTSQAIRGVALGIVVTALVQAVLAGTGLAIAGVPFPALLTAVMFMLAAAQIRTRSGPDWCGGLGLLAQRRHLGHVFYGLGDFLRHLRQLHASDADQARRRSAPAPDFRGRGRGCLQRYKTEPVYRRKNEPPLAGCLLSLC
jgi:hypothetical protein